MPHLRRAVALLALFALLAGAACGGDDSDGADNGGAAGAGDGDGGFPVRVEHRHGTTEIPEEPERVVTVGISDQDAVLAFGVTPVAVTYWYGDHPHATWPWAQDDLGDAEPVVLNEGEFTGEQDFDYERIAELRPDLIIGLYTGMSEEEYDTLSQIAPTVAPSGDYPEWTMPWQETTRMVGQALGQPERAEELIDEVEGQFAEAAADNPEFEGVEMAIAEVFEPGQTYARGPNDPRTRFMTSLGFVLPDEIAELAESEDGEGASISDEQLDLLDRDLLIWNIGWDPALREQIEAKPLYPRLDAVRDGRELFIEDELVSGALTWSTVLSLPYAIEHLVPDLADTVAG